MLSKNQLKEEQDNYTVIYMDDTSSKKFLRPEAYPMPPRIPTLHVVLRVACMGLPAALTVFTAQACRSVFLAWL